jgi:N-acetylornithine carbamoyltransferase
VNDELVGRHFLALEDFLPSEIDVLLDRSAGMMTTDPARPLAGRSAALVFLNPSLRTRTSFEVAMARLGGHAVVLSPGADAWKLESRDGVVMDGAAAEHVREAAPVLASMCDLIGVRSFPEMKSFEEDAREAVLRSFAAHSPVPVVNMESALSHPLQALADLLTFRQVFGNPRRRRLLLTWAYHPKPLPIAVPRSLLLAACRAGMQVTLARPRGFELPEETMAMARRFAAETGGDLAVCEGPDEAFDGQEVVYAKSWASPAFYGRFAEEAPVRGAARDWRVTAARMERTAPGAPFMHCLPVRRNVVVDDAVLDGPRSIVVRQAANRLTTTMAVALSLLGAGGGR